MLKGFPEKDKCSIENIALGIPACNWATQPCCQCAINQTLALCTTACERLLAEKDKETGEALETLEKEYKKLFYELSNSINERYGKIGDEFIKKAELKLKKTKKTKNEQLNQRR